jgi:hypothetical protein
LKGNNVIEYELYLLLSEDENRHLAKLFPTPGIKYVIAGLHPRRVFP